MRSRAQAAVNSFVLPVAEAADWSKAKDGVSRLRLPISARLRTEKVGETAELESVACACLRTQVDQPPGSDGRLWSATLAVVVPARRSLATGQMYVASALGKHGMTSTKAPSSLTATLLCWLSSAPRGNAEIESVRSKLLFAFTAILPRASKRYQWSKARPLNAANANYYVAPVFYEWNVFDLFRRKVEAAAKSDEFIRSAARLPERYDRTSRRRIRAASATALPLDDASVDYVFTDPPFGWNIFYYDMNLFQEAWLDGRTVPTERRSSIGRSPRGHARLTATNRCWWTPYFRSWSREAERPRAHRKASNIRLIFTMIAAVRHSLGRRARLVGTPARGAVPTKLLSLMCPALHENQAKGHQRHAMVGGGPKTSVSSCRVYD